MLYDKKAITNEKPSHNKVTISISCELIMEQLGIDVEKFKKYLEVK